MQQEDTFNAGIVFLVTSVAQFVIPSPLDTLLLPAAVTYWYVKTKQQNAVVDSLRAHALNVYQAAANKVWVTQAEPKTETDE